MPHTTATQNATHTSPYQTRSKTFADMRDENEMLDTPPYQTRSETLADSMDENEMRETLVEMMDENAMLDTELGDIKEENEMLTAELDRLEARVKYPVIYRRDLDDPGRHGEGAMDGVFAGDVDYPLIMRIGKWHDGRLSEQNELLPDCVTGEIEALAPRLAYYAAGEEVEVWRTTQHAVALHVRTTSKTLKAFLSNEHIWGLLPLTRAYESSQIEVRSAGGTFYINHQPAPPYYTHNQF